MKTKINQINKKVASLLKANNSTLSIAESCTGGLFSDYITNVSGASRYFSGSVVSYSNDSKENILKVPKKLLKNYGAVSSEVGLAMAAGAKKIFLSNIAVSVTGIAGPKGETKTKPIGLVYISLIDKNGIKLSKRFYFKGSRNTIKLKAVYEMFCVLYDYLK